MRILVTGGNGRIGRFLLSELISHGHEVTSLDLTAPAAPVAGVRTMRGDASRIEDVYGAASFAKAEAVIHMAAWSDPGIVPDARTYGDNVVAAFNVLDVSQSLGLRRVLLASSAQVYGFAGHAPLYAPVDEEHPLRPLNSYALSKVAGEQAAAYFAGRGLNVLSLRIMGARMPDDLPEEVAAARRDPGAGRFLLWTRSDARDIARGCRQALEADEVASGAYNLTGRVNVLGVSTAELFRQHAPETELLAGLSGPTSGLSIEKAQKAFGYAPQWAPQP